VSLQLEEHIFSPQSKPPQTKISAPLLLASVVSLFLTSYIGSPFIFSISRLLSVVGLGPSPHCSQVVWCHCGEIEPFSATLAQDELAECDQPGKNPSEYSAVVGN